MANLCLFLCFVCSVQLCRALAPEAVSEDLLQAIRCVESNGDVCAIGDNGRSIGAYQIMRGYYDDALEFSSELRAIGKEYTDLWGEGSVEYSESVIRAYMCRYATEGRLGRNATNEDISRIHNGGPNGWQNPNTDGYWTRVSDALSNGCEAVTGSDMCEPRCTSCQCCQQDDEGRYRCFCIQERADSPGLYASRPYENCSVLAGVDLVFVLDSSTSIGRNNFQTMKNFVNTFVNSLEIGPTRSQVGVIIFSTGASVQFNLDTYSDRESLTDAVNAIQYTGGGTNTASALNLLASNGFIGARPESEAVPRVAIVVTDGMSNSAEATETAAEALQQNQSSITIYAVGISGANLQELNVIASAPNLVRFISSFAANEIEMLQEDLNEQACTASTVVEVEAISVSRTIPRNTRVYLEYDVPSEGFTVTAEVEEGAIVICGSRSLQRPDCSYRPSYDWRLEVQGNAEIFINGQGVPANQQQSISKRQVDSGGNENVTVFVTIEGLESQNSFMMNTTVGDTTTPMTTMLPTTVDGTMEPDSDGGAIVATSTIAGVFLCSLLVSMSLL